MLITNRKRTDNDTQNKPRQKYRLGTVSNKLLGYWNQVLGVRSPVLGYSIPVASSESSTCKHPEEIIVFPRPFRSISPIKVFCFWHHGLISSIRVLGAGEQRFEIVIVFTFLVSLWRFVDFVKDSLVDICWKRADPSTLLLTIPRRCFFCGLA